MLCTNYTRLCSHSFYPLIKILGALFTRFTLPSKSYRQYIRFIHFYFRSISCTQNFSINVEIKKVANSLWQRCYW